MNPVPYTLQTAFDTVLAGIRSQGHRASVKQRNDDSLAAICQYRGLGGRKCAFGWLLPDSLVNPKWDDGAGTTAAHLLHHGQVRALFDMHISDDTLVDFSRALQSAHDHELLYHSPDAWEACMKRIAEHYGLTYTPKEISA